MIQNVYQVLQHVARFHKTARHCTIVHHNTKKNPLAMASQPNRMGKYITQYHIANHCAPHSYTTTRTEPPLKISQASQELSEAHPQRLNKAEATFCDHY